MTVDDMPAPYQITDAESLIAAANAAPRTELRALVARIVIDSLGRPWDPIKHPRDSAGRFIETFAEIRGLFRTHGGAKGAPQVTGRVVAFDHNGDVWVRLDHTAPGYTEHRVGEIVPIKPDDMEALPKLATIPKALDANQRSQVEALAARMEGTAPQAATALRRAVDPANTQPIAQLADLHEARDLLDQNGTPDAIAVRDLVWDLSDQLGDHPSNDEVLKSATAMMRDHRAGGPVARINAPAPAGQPSAPDRAQVLAGQLHGVADRMQDQNPADAVHVRNVAAALGNVGLTGQDVEARDHALERAAVAAANIKTPQLRKKILADIKDMRENPPEENAPAAPEQKATLPPPPPAASLPPETPDAGALVDWARANAAAKPGGIKPHENPDGMSHDELRVRQAKIDAEIQAVKNKADAHEDGRPIEAQAQLLNRLIAERDAIDARLALPEEAPPETKAELPGGGEPPKGPEFSGWKRTGKGRYHADNGLDVADPNYVSAVITRDPDSKEWVAQFFRDGQPEDGASVGTPTLAETQKVAQQAFEHIGGDASNLRDKVREAERAYNADRPWDKEAPAPEAPPEPVAEIPPVPPSASAPVDTPTSASPDEEDSVDLAEPETVQEPVPAVPELPPLGELGLGIQWEDMPHGLVLRGNVFPHKDDAKALGFRFLEVPGEKKRDGAPFKAWTAIGTPEQRRGMLGHLAERLGLPDPAAAADVADEYPPTPQQQDIIDAVDTGQDVVVRALAGTGKTSTLKMIARRLFKSDPNKRIVYVAFNKSIQEEAKATMPPNVEARTGDSIAFATMSPAMKDKYSDRSTLRRNADIAAFLGITKPLDTGVPGEKPMQPDEQAMRVMRAIEKYSISADDKLGVQHFKNLDPEVAKELLPFAEKAWTDINSDKGRIRTTNSHITKMWALSRPDLSKTTSGLQRAANIVFFDEAQDINPVMAKVIADQKIQKVYVGDSNQAIYGFRGAVDELDHVKVDHDLPLTKSWRFGPQIASMGNRFLALIGSKHRIEGAGPEGRVVEPYSMTDPDAILVRSNAGAIGEILQAQTDGKIVGVPKGTKSDLRKLVDTARWLQSGGPAPAQVHDDLAAFRNWDEVKAAADAGDDPKVKMLAKIIEETGVDKLSDLVNRLVESGDRADNRTPDMYVTTAHKAKGLEWDKVQIGGDFWGPRMDKQTGLLVMPSPEEMKLAYVAVTRAMKELDPGSLAWVYEYTDSNGGAVKPDTTTPTPPPPPTVPSSPTHWFPEGAVEFPGEASRPLGPSAPLPDEIATKAGDLGLAPETLDAIKSGTAQQIEEALSKDERFAEIQHTYARAAGATIRTPEAEKARAEWIALQRDVLIPLSKRGVRANFIRPKTEVPPAPPTPPEEAVPEGWVKAQPEPGWDPGDIWGKGAYAVMPNDDGGLRVAEYDENNFPIWRADGANWADVEAKIAEHEDFKKNGGLPADQRAYIADRAANYGFGPDVVEAIRTGDAKQIADALDADPRYHEMAAANADALGADLPQGDDRVAIDNWIGFQSHVIAPLMKAKLLKKEPKPKVLRTEQPQAPEVPPVAEAPAVPAYSGEIREIQPRDLGEIIGIPRNVQQWLDYAPEIALIKDPFGAQEPGFLDGLKRDWQDVADAVRKNDFVGAQHAIDAVKDAVADPNVRPAFREDMQAYVDQAQGVLDKVGQRAQGQFEIPGVAQPSVPPYAEQSAPELNAAFADVLQHDPNASSRVKRLAAELEGFRQTLESYGQDSDLADQVTAAIDALNNQDYHRAFNLLDGVFNQPPGTEPTNDYETGQDRYSNYADFGIVNDVFSLVWDDWTAMLDANPDLQKYNPDVPTPAPATPASQEPLQEWERALLDAIGPQPGDHVGTEGPEGDVPGPYNPAADPEIVIPDPPKGGGEVKDENRVINPRVRGEIEDVKRGIGLPELPDRLDIDRNGVAVFALDLVDVPAAGNQGPQGGMRRPAGIAQVRRIYTKNGVRYAEVAFYDPAFVDAPNRNKAKRDLGLKNNSPFYVWDGVRIDKIQKVDGTSPDAVEYLGHLGPEDARQYAGRNAGRLAQNRGRVRPELERMANLQYIGDRYAPDANGLPVGKGDVVVYNGKKYEVVRINNDNPGIGNNVRVDLLPLGADGAPEIQAGGKHAEPYARMVQFYDQPLGDRKPAVTVDELKDLVRRLDVNKKYVVGDALRNALESGDLKEITRAFNEDPAILTYVADGRAYINDYIDRLLQANLLGNFDAINKHEQEMVRKDKNDLLNAMAAVDGRFLEGTGADRHIRREIPMPGPDRAYTGNQPEVLMPLRYVQMKDELAKARAAHPENDGLYHAMQVAVGQAGAINLDDPWDFVRAQREFVALRKVADGEGDTELSAALAELLNEMDHWREEQDKRRAMVQGGPGGEAQLPRGRTVAPGLVRPPDMPSAPAAPAGPNAEDQDYGARMAADADMRDRYMKLRDNLDVAIAAMLDARNGPGAEYLREAKRAFLAGRYGEGLRAIDHVTAVPEYHPNAYQLKNWQDELVGAGVYFDLRGALNRVRSDWPEDFPGTPEPAVPAKPVVPRAPAAPHVDAEFNKAEARNALANYGFDRLDNGDFEQSWIQSGDAGRLREAINVFWQDGFDALSPAQRDALKMFYGNIDFRDFTAAPTVRDAYAGDGQQLLLDFYNALNETPAAPAVDNRAEIDRTNPVHNIVNYFQHNPIGGIPSDTRAGIFDAVNAWQNGDEPDPKDRKILRDYLVQAAETTDDAVLRRNMNDWIKYLDGGVTAPVAPAVPQKPAVDMPDYMRAFLRGKGDAFIRPQAKDAAEALNAGMVPNAPDLAMLHEDVQNRIDLYQKRGDNPGRLAEYQEIKDWLDTYAPVGGGAAPAAPAVPQNPEDARKAIADVIEARYAELRADRKNNVARKQAEAVQEAGDFIDQALSDAIKIDAANPDHADIRDQAIANAIAQVDKIKPDNPELAAELERQIKGVIDHFKSQDQARLINRYLAEADKFHNRDTPNNDQRDRMVRAAQDQIDMARSNYPALAAEMQARLDGMKEQYAADDIERARAVPVGRTEALDSFDAQVEAERKRLREAGDPTAARHVVARADVIAEKLNDAEDAHKAGDPDGRDSALDEARAAIQDLEDISPDLAEEARKAVEGNAARYAREDAAKAEPEGPFLSTLPKPKKITLKEMKKRGRDIALAVQARGVDDIQQYFDTPEQAWRALRQVNDLLAPAGVDRRREARVRVETDEAARILQQIATLDELRQLRAISRGQDEIPFHQLTPEAQAKIDQFAVEGLDAVRQLRLLAAQRKLSYDGRRAVKQISDAFFQIVLNPDEQNMEHRVGRQAIRNAIAELEQYVNPGSEPSAPLDKLNTGISQIGDLPPRLPGRPRAGGAAGADAIAGGLDTQAEWDVLREDMAPFVGMRFNDIKNAGTIGDWNLERKLSNGINAVLLFHNPTNDHRLVIKYDNDYGKDTGNGADAEDMVAHIYRDLGFAQPPAAVVNPDATDIQHRGVVAMGFVDDGFYGLADAQMWSDVGLHRLSQIDPAYHKELLMFLTANGIVGNSDRHGHNLMVARDPDTGLYRIVVIDNGLAMMNSNFGDGARYPDTNPNDAPPPRAVGWRHVLHDLVGQYIDSVGKAQAKNEMIELAQRMQTRAKVLNLINENGANWLDARAQWIIDHLDEFIRDGLRYQK